MRKHIALLVFFLAAAKVLQAQEPRPLRVDDIFALKTVGDPQDQSGRKLGRIHGFVDEREGGRLGYGHLQGSVCGRSTRTDDDESEARN